MAKSPLQTELAQRGLVSLHAAAEMLHVDQRGLKSLIGMGQLKPDEFEWKGTSRRGIPKAQLRDVEVIFKDGGLRLRQAADLREQIVP